METGHPYISESNSIRLPKLELELKNNVSDIEIKYWNEKKYVIYAVHDLKFKHKNANIVYIYT